MNRKPSISEEQAHSSTERDSVHPVRAQELEKQYHELCRLREQVQIAESRRRVLPNG
jgi:hypothetical protein